MDGTPHLLEGVGLLMLCWLGYQVGAESVTCMLDILKPLRVGVALQMRIAFWKKESDSCSLGEWGRPPLPESGSPFLAEAQRLCAAAVSCGLPWLYQSGLGSGRSDPGACKGQRVVSGDCGDSQTICPTWRAWPGLTSSPWLPQGELGQYR